MPASYRFEMPQACLDNAEKASRPVRSTAARYAVCADQMALFTKALAEARAAQKLVLVTFGATWCPSCAHLQRQLPTVDVLGHQDGNLDFGRAFHHVEIATSATDKGQKIAIASGEAVLALVMSRVTGVDVRAIPFVAVVDPDSRERVFARNIDDLAIGPAGAFDPVRLRAILQQAHAHVRTGAPATTEPGWLRRKFLRWWHS